MVRAAGAVKAARHGGAGSTAAAPSIDGQASFGDLGLWQLDTAGTTVFANAALCRALGVSDAAELMLFHPRDFMGKEAAGLLSQSSPRQPRSQRCTLRSLGGAPDAYEGAPTPRLSWPHQGLSWRLLLRSVSGSLAESLPAAPFCYREE